MSAEALSRLDLSEWTAAEAASTKVEVAIDHLYDLIEEATDAWSVCKFGEARDAERDLKLLASYLWAANYGR
jgi:hypothetical protein